MTENDQENFFVSDSLKGILEKDDLIQQKIESRAEAGEEIFIPGKFVKLSLEDMKFTISSDTRMLKILLKNPGSVFCFNFMDEVWQLSAETLMIESKSEGQLHLTLAITGRR